MANRVHIGIFGRRNVGKSSVINALTGQQVAIVSARAGTTTDPVKKTIELFGIGAVTLIDTAGIDDAGPVGSLRAERSKQLIEQIDAAILIIAGNQFGAFEEALIHAFRACDVPFVALHNKADQEKITPALVEKIKTEYHTEAMDFTALHLPQPLPTREGSIERVIQLLQSIIPETTHPSSLLSGLVQQGDTVLLIAPIDSEAPQGRLILPQVQTIREALNNRCIAVVVKETEVEAYLKNAPLRPALAVTDSQLFGKIDKIIPPDIPLTGFSILLARCKGNFENYRKGTPAIDQLQHGNRVLILESCTHQSTCDDIGRVKIPRLLQQYTGKTLAFDIVSGLSPLPHALARYALAVQCGACMITPRQLKNRLKPLVEAGIPITNYGMAMAYMNGLYERAMAAMQSNE